MAILITLDADDVAALRELHAESLRSRTCKHPRVMHFWRGFDPHDLIDRLIAKVKEATAE